MWLNFQAEVPWEPLFEETTPAHPGHFTLTGLGTSEAAKYSKTQSDALVRSDQDSLAELRKAEELESISPDRS